MKLQSTQLTDTFTIEIGNCFKQLVARNLSELAPSPNSRRFEFSHKIELKAGSEPIKQKTRGVPYAAREQFRKEIAEMKAAGLISDTKSPFSSPVRLVQKKGTDRLRVTIDYRKVNNITIKDAYPIPKIQERLTHLSEAKYFTTIDLCSGYYQIPLEKASREVTAFSCEWGHFERNVLPMGMTNSGASFQRAMDKILHEYIGKFCLVYLDDIIVYSKTKAEHIRHSKLVADIET